MKKQIKTSWTLKTNTIVGVSNEYFQLKEAVYTAHYSPNKSLEVAVVAIRNKKTRKIWIGQKQDFYVETSSKIIGGSLTPSGVLQWCDGLIVGSNKEDLDSAINHFDKDIDGPTLAQPCMGPNSDLRKVLKRRFFTRRSDYDSENIQIKVKAIEMQKMKVQIDLENPITHSNAMVWIDAKSWEPVKAIVDGEQVYPK